jgi:hypothetical protein
MAAGVVQGVEYLPGSARTSVQKNQSIIWNSWVPVNLNISNYQMKKED